MLILTLTDSFLGGLLALLRLLLFLFGLHALDSLEFLNKESSDDSILDFTASEDSTVGSGDSSLGSGHSLALSWSGDLDTLVSISPGFLLDVPNAQFTTCKHKKHELDMKLTSERRK